MLRISFILSLALQERYVVEEFEIYKWSHVYFRILLLLAMVVAIAFVLLFPMMLQLLFRKPWLIVLQINEEWKSVYVIVNMYIEV